MSVSYKKLLHLLVDKGLTTSDLAKMAGLSLNIIGRIKKDEYVSMETIENICDVLSCTPNDIFEFIEEEKNENN